MANLDDLFARPKQYDHPRLRSWLSYKNSPDTRRCYIEFRRERDGLVFKPARLYLVAERKDDLIFSDDEPWDDDFNTALVERQFKARDKENEGERFGYMLTGRMQPLVNQFNDGFFNSVLVRYLNQNGYAKLAPIAAKLAKIHTYNPHEGQATIDCEERIDSVLARCVEQLDRLGYGATEGKGILAAAIAYYLDDRFSITNSEMLGW